MIRRPVLLLAALAACGATAEHADQGRAAPAPPSAVPVVRAESGAIAQSTADTTPRTASTSGTPGTPSAPPGTSGAGGGASGAGGSGAPIRGATVPGLDPNTAVIRALYVNRWAAQSSKRMRQLIDIADRTEINGLVIDMKDEFGLNYRTTSPSFAKNAGTAGVVPRLVELLDTLRAHRILAIARIVVFKDSVTARVHPEWTIRRTDGSVWRDKKGIAWVNPYHRELWDYNIGVAEELVKLGFQEIQWDYIRFPEPYRSLPQQVFPNADGVSKPDAIAAYLKLANERLDRLGVRSTADIFGLVTTVRGPLEVGQWWEKISPNVDVVLPMVYPSHYPRGSFGLKVPNAQPYETIRTALEGARRRDEALGISPTGHVRPWLQAFTLGAPDYGPEQLEAMKKATYDVGYQGWVMWNPGSKYEVFLPGLEKGGP